MRLLIVEDDKVTSRLISEALKAEGFAVDACEDGRQGLDLALVNKGNFCAIVLDILLPSVDGLSICKKIREEDDLTPILLLSTRDQVEHIVEGLDIGADDYLTKPFEVSELLARVKALCRRKINGPNDLNQIIRVRDIELNVDTHELKVQGEPVAMSNLEFRLLRLLMENKGKVVLRSEIIEKVWDRRGDDLMSNTIDVHINQLRRKVKDDKKDPIITTVRGSGYRFEEE